MSPLFDVAAVNAAGAAHGQLASALPDGIALSAHKLVEEGARAQLLILPGVVRIDVRPLPDGLQVVPRPLAGTELGWEVDPSAVTDYGKTALETRAARGRALPARVLGRERAARRAAAGRLHARTTGTGRRTSSGTP